MPADTAETAGQRPADKEWKPVEASARCPLWIFCPCGHFPCVTLVLLIYCPPILLDYLITHVIAQPQVEVASFGFSQPFASLMQSNHTYSKHVLVVGGTKGIGRGITEELLRPENGVRMGGETSVTVIGRDRQAFIDLRESVLDHDPDGKEDDDSRKLNFIAADLSNIEACRQLVEKLVSDRGQGKGHKFDKVVFTVGAWPHFEEPITIDGFDRVVHLDVIARHTLLKGLYDSGLLWRGDEKEGIVRRTQVINVLASSRIQHGVTYSDDDLKVYLRNWLEDDRTLAERHWTNWLATMPFIAETCDIWLKKAAEKMPGVDFVGTFPGIVKTDLTFETFGRPLFFLAQLLPIWTNIFVAGKQHLGIMLGAEALIAKQRATKSEGSPNIAFFDHKLFARKGNNMERDAYGDWLWDLLEAIRSGPSQVQKGSPPQMRPEMGKDEL